MGMTTVASVIERAAGLLQDVSHIRWTQEELVDWINDGQREAVVYKPSACTKNANIPLVAGTKQSLPDDCNVLFEIVRNMGADGATPGAGISVVERGLLDAQMPDWHMQKNAKAAVKHYTYSPLDQKTFYVYPASTGGVLVEASYGAVPATVAFGDVISIDDVCSVSLLNYLMFRAYSKDTEFAPNTANADRFYQSFLLNLKGRVSAEAAAPSADRS